MTLRPIKTTAICLLAAAMLPLLFACSTTSTGTGELVVNEIVSSNKRSLVDNALGTPDWIELYNAGTAAIDLSGYGISDNMRDLHKFVFPKGTTLGAGEYLILYAMSRTEDMAAEQR